MKWRSRVAAMGRSIEEALLKHTHAERALALRNAVQAHVLSLLPDLPEALEFANTPADKIPITEAGIQESLRLAGLISEVPRGRLSHTISQLLYELRIARDPEGCCPSDQFVLRYFIDHDQERLVRVCDLCSATYPLIGEDRLTPSLQLPATRELLVAEGLA